MKSNQILFAIASLMISVSAQAQVDGASNEVSRGSRSTSLSLSQKNEVDRFLDAERKKNESAYKDLFKETDGQSPVIVVDLRSVTDQNIDKQLAEYQKSFEKRFESLDSVPDSFAIAIQNSVRVHHENKIVEVIMKAAAKHKNKLEAKARLKAQNADGALKAGADGVIENAGRSNNLDGKFSMKIRDKGVMLVWKKQTMTW